MPVDRQQLEDALPDYEILGELGRGAWGVVVEGRHRTLDRRVAIKQLPPALSTEAEVRARFVTEARLLASFQHPHIVGVYDFVERDGRCLLVMELLSGGTVWDRMASSGVSTEEACAIGAATCAGLSYAHERRVLHRDVKPENLVFSGTGVLKITDFGISKILGGTRTLATAAGTVLGSPAYIAPEQVAGEPAAEGSDVYAVGTMLYELLSGDLPFPDEGDAVAMLLSHVRDEPRPLGDLVDGLAPEIGDVVMRAIAREPGDRYASADACGLAVVQAATDALGAAWVQRSRVPIAGDGAIADAVRDVSTRTPDSRRSDADVRDSRVIVTPRLQSSAQIETVDPSELVSIPELVNEDADDTAGTTLEVHEPDRPPRSIELLESCEVGREVEGITVGDSEVSRRHLALDVEDAKVFVRDLGSTNGTYLNGKALKARAELKVGDTVRFGRCSIVAVGRERRRRRLLRRRQRD